MKVAASEAQEKGEEMGHCIFLRPILSMALLILAACVYYLDKN